MSSSKILKRAGAGILLPAVIFLTTIGIISYNNSITPTGIVIHHSAVPFPADNPLDVIAIDEIHKRRGYGIFYWGQTYHVGYHYIILPDGTLQPGRPEKCKGAHAKGFNDYIGICLIGDFSPSDNKNGNKGPQHPTPEQLQTLEEIVGKLRKGYDIPLENIRTHKELDAQTECPGESFPIKDFFERIGKSE
ncbi:MAG TPA: peptidoglycan recognition family protein [Pyrinomonadaceae bacterium]|jgi:hypothetical protein